MNIEEQIYACKYLDKLGLSQISEDLKKPKEEIEDCLQKLKNNGIYKQYKNMSEEDYDNIIKNEPKKRGRPRKIENEKPQVTTLTVDIDYRKENEVLRYKLEMAQKENERYKTALLNICLKL